MKIYHKLTLGFWGTALLVGAVATIAFWSNAKLERNYRYISESSTIELDKVTEMTLTLQNTQMALHWLTHEEYKTIDSQQAWTSIQQQLTEFQTLLTALRVATERGAVIAAQTQDLASAEAERDELQLISQIQRKFDYYQAQVIEYQRQVTQTAAPVDPELEQSISVQFAGEILPLLEIIRGDTQAELDTQTQAVAQSLVLTNRTALATIFVALLVAPALGWLVFRTIAKPLFKLEQAAARIGEGHLDTQVDVKGQDEVGLLATTFNTMASRLQQTTVSKSYVDSILSAMTDSLVVTTWDTRIIKVNQATLDMLGYNEFELLHHPIERLFAEETGLGVRTLVQNEFLGNLEIHYQTKGGERIPVSFSVAPMINDLTGERQIVCVARNISDRKRMEMALRQSEAQFRRLYESNLLGICFGDIYGRLIDANQAFLQMVGYSRSELQSGELPWHAMTPPEYAEIDQEMLRQLQETGICQPYEKEYFCRDGSRIFVLVGVARLDHSPDQVVCFVLDISDRKAAEEQLVHDALHDTLTGLPNRLLFIDRLEHAISRAKRQEDFQFAVLFLDLDRFKVINDSLGHLAGDKLLITIAERLQQCVRDVDTVARLGGDEFTILLEGIHSLTEVMTTAERVQADLKVPIELEGQEVYTTASIGVVPYSDSYQSSEELLRDADIAMYQAKTSGKAQFALFQAGMHNQAMAQLLWENDLRRALERQEFQLYYQPLISLNTGALEGFEALLRWHHPEQGVIAPTAYMPLAEETGLIYAIGEWVMHEACRQMQSWQNQNASQSLMISINLSCKQFSQSDLIDQISHALAQTGLNPCCLNLEVTESAIMENPEQAATMLLELQNLGVGLHIDDFGTGYSSLSYLQRLPVNTLKIDQLFIQHMEIGQSNLKLVETIVMMAQNLGITVIAEGIETREQLMCLRRLNCQYGQGYLFSQPVPSEIAEALIATPGYWRDMVLETSPRLSSQS